MPINELASSDLELFRRSDTSWSDGDLQSAFDLQEKIVSLSENDYAGLLIRAGYILLESGKYDEASSWFSLAEKHINPNSFIGMPCLFAELYVMAILGRIKSYCLSEKTEKIRLELPELIKWLAKSEKELLEGPLAHSRKHIEKMFPLVNKGESPLVNSCYPLWVDIDFGCGKETYCSFKHDVETISYLYKNLHQITHEPEQQAFLMLFYAYYVVLNTKENGFEESENIFRQAIKLSNHSAILQIAKEQAQLTVIALQENLDVSLQEVEEAIRFDPNNKVLLDYRKILIAKPIQNRPLEQKRLSVQVISETTPFARDSIFFSPQEQRVYEAMIDVFTSYLVLPNLALHAVIDYKELQKAVTTDEFRYYLQTHVDFCLVSKSDYCPVAGFELDSTYHDTSDGQEKDRRKNLFFRLARIPLIRLRNPSHLTDMEIRLEIRQVAKISGLAM